MVHLATVSMCSASEGFVFGAGSGVGAVAWKGWEEFRVGIGITVGKSWGCNQDFAKGWVWS